jgi:hypothetical protein
MTNSKGTNITRRIGEEPRPFFPISRHVDDIFEDFRRDMESVFHSWPYSMADWQFPVLASMDKEIRLPVCELCDMGGQI